MAGCSVGLESRGSWDAEVELVAVVVRSAVAVGRAVDDILNWLGDTDATLIALFAIGAGAIRRLAESRRLLGDHFAVSYAESELIALVASGAGATLSACAGLVGLRLEASGNAVTELIAVLSSRASTAFASLASAIWNWLSDFLLRRHDLAVSDAEAKLIALVAGWAGAALAACAGLVWLRLEAASNAEAEFVAVVSRRASATLSTLASSIGLGLEASSDTETELIAVIAWGAFATLATFASSVGSRLVYLLCRHDLAVSDAEAKLIALVAGWAGAALATCAGLVGLRPVVSRNAETELVAVVARRAGAAFATLAGSVDLSDDVAPEGLGRYSEEGQHSDRDSDEISHLYKL